MMSAMMSGVAGQSCCVYAKFLADSKQFIHTVGAGMACQHGLQSMLGQFARCFWLMQQVAHMLLHLFTIGRNQIIFAGGKKPFHIMPGGTDQWNATR